MNPCFYIRTISQLTDGINLNTENADDNICVLMSEEHFDRSVDRSIIYIFRFWTQRRMYWFYYNICDSFFFLLVKRTLRPELTMHTKTILLQFSIKASFMKAFWILLVHWWVGWLECHFYLNNWEKLGFIKFQFCNFFVFHYFWGFG